MDWAAIAIAIPGADEHPSFEQVAAWAAWGATSRGDYERARQLLADIAAVEAGLHGPSFSRASAVLALFEGDLQGARRHADEWVAAARTLGEPSALLAPSSCSARASSSELRARGAAFELHEALVYLRTEAARALGTE
jgi:hypothetical protein